MQDKIPTAENSTEIAGKVTETMDSGGYTYVAVEKDGRQTWIAVPLVKVTVGQEVSFIPGIVMHNFTSKTLGRTFETIIFSGGLASSLPQPGKAAPAL